MKRLYIVLAASLAICISAAARTSKTIEMEDCSGPYKAVAVEDNGLPGYTIYRPEDLKLAKDSEGRLPVILFGNGGCARNSWDFKNFLSEIASHGYIVIANGNWTPRTPWPAADPAPQNTEQRPQAAPNAPAVDPQEAMMAAFKASESQNVEDAKDYLRALDWLESQTKDKSSEYYKAVNTSNVAAMGQSCGGAQAIILGSSGDKRIKTTMPLNSGVVPLGDSYWMVDKEALKDIKKPMCYLCGGPTDIAYANTEDDYSRISHIPVVAAHYPVGHGGTYSEKNGGTFADMALLWLDLQLKGKKENEDIFRNAKLPANLQGWELKSKNW